MAYIILNNRGGHTGRFKKKCLHLFYVMLKQTHFSHWQELEDTQRSRFFSPTKYVILIFLPTGKVCATDNSCLFHIQYV